MLGRVRLARVPSLASAERGYCATQRTFGRIFPCRGTSYEATGKNCDGVECGVVTTPITYPQSLFSPSPRERLPATGKTCRTKSLRVASLHLLRGSSGRVTRSLYSCEHGTTDAAAGFLDAKLFSGVAGEPSHAPRFLDLILFLSRIPNGTPIRAAVWRQWVRMSNAGGVCPTNADGNDGGAAARCCRCSINN
jgi:hypothetical protein